MAEGTFRDRWPQYFLFYFTPHFSVLMHRKLRVYFGFNTQVLWNPDSKCANKVCIVWHTEHNWLSLRLITWVKQKKYISHGLIAIATKIVQQIGHNFHPFTIGWFCNSHVYSYNIRKQLLLEWKTTIKFERIVKIVA